MKNFLMKARVKYAGQIVDVICSFKFNRNIFLSIKSILKEILRPKNI